MPEPTMVSSVTVDPRLPSAQQLPAGLLATTDADWLIATVTGSADDESAPSGTVKVVDLISPDGVRYELPPLGAFSLDQWLPGTSLGLGIDDSAPPAALAVVDLETGEEVARPDLTGLLADVPGATSLEATFVGDGTTDLVITVRSASAGRTVRVTLDGSVVAELDRGPGPDDAEPDRHRAAGRRRHDLHARPARPRDVRRGHRARPRRDLLPDDVAGRDGVARLVRRRRARPGSWSSPPVRGGSPWSRAPMSRV